MAINFNPNYKNTTHDAPVSTMPPETIHNQTVAAARVLLNNIKYCFCNENKEELFNLLYGFFHPKSSLEDKSKIFEQIKKMANPAVSDYFTWEKNNNSTMTFIFGDHKSKITVPDTRQPENSINNDVPVPAAWKQNTIFDPKNKEFFPGKIVNPKWNDLLKMRHSKMEPLEFPEKKITHFPEIQKRPGSDGAVSITKYEDAGEKGIVISGSLQAIKEAFSQIGNVLQEHPHGFTLCINGRKHPGFFDPKSGRVYPGEAAFKQGHPGMTLADYLNNILSLSERNEVTIIIKDNSPRK